MLLAFRLAAYVEGTVDVDGVLERLTPELMDRWEAFDALEPIGNVKLLDVLANIGTVIASANGAEVQPDDFKPWLKSVEREKSGAELLAETRRMMRAAYGA